MIEIKGDIWQEWGRNNKSDYICIPTNGMTKANGRAVMGAGMAKRATVNIPGIDEWLGEKLAEFGNQLFVNVPLNYVTFPTKNDWRASSDLKLIKEAAERLSYLAHIILFNGCRVLLPRVGCGLGGLDWEVVRPILEKALHDDRFVIVSQ